MTVFTRSARPLLLALTAGMLAMGSSARAQDVGRAATSLATNDSSVTPSVSPHTAPAGPTMDAAAVGVRNAPDASTAPAAPPRGGYGQPVALMVVGGAALIAGLIIGGGAGTAIAIGGAVAGLIGLYQYMQ